MAKPSPHPVWIPVRKVKGKGSNRGEVRVPMEVVLRGDYAFISFKPLNLTDFEVRDPQFDHGVWSESLEVMSADLPEAEDILF